MNARIDLSLSRREFLKASGALIVSATGTAFAGEALAQSAGATAKPALLPTELDSWVAILPDGRVTAFFGKMDMGQSLDIAIAQIVADELRAGCWCNPPRRNLAYRSSNCESTTAWSAPFPVP